MLHRKDRQQFLTMIEHSIFSTVLAHHDHNHIMFWYITLILNPESFVFGLKMSLVCGTDVIINMSCHLGMVFKSLATPHTAISMCISVHNYV